MAGNETQFVCCFCGKSIEGEQPVRLVVFPLLDSDESQNLYCHRAHLVERLAKGIPVHPDLLGD